MRRGILVAAAIGLAAAVAIAVTLVVNRDTPTAKAQTVRHVVFLFSQDAAGGSLTGPDDQHLTLTLHGVRDWVTRFDDRPFHAGQTVDILDFLDRWKGRFGSSPPNAVLSYLLPSDTRPRDMVLELRNPVYDAAAKTITYHARRIRRTSDRLPGTKHPLRPVVYPIPASFGAASLFIDDADDEQCVDENDNPVACDVPDPGDSGGGDYGGGSGGGPAMM